MGTDVSTPLYQLFRRCLLKNKLMDKDRPKNICIAHLEPLAQDGLKADFLNCFYYCKEITISVGGI